ncbi:MAG: ACT domain-containing protein [Oscillospiraceae bacterium]|jgi:hypothetical protein
MFIQQLSIFVENKPGRLSEVTRLLKDNDVDIRALSIADTRDFGIMRLIVNNPSKAEKVLKEAGCTVSLTNVIAIGIEDKPGGLSQAMEILYANNISVEYMYAFVSRTDSMAYVILRVENNERAVTALKENNIKILETSEIYEM